MGILRSSKPKANVSENEHRQTRPEADAGAWWVDRNGDALWTGVLGDDALEGLLGADLDVEPPEVANSEPAAQNGKSQGDGGDLALAMSRPQEPGTPEFRILCGARTADEIRRRFGWKTDKELAEAYEIALEEHARAKADGDQVDAVYWAALVEASVTEAVSRPTFGGLTEWEEVEDRREMRQILGRLDTLARARENALKTSAG